MRRTNRCGTRGCDAPKRSVAQSGMCAFLRGSWNTPTEGRASCTHSCKFRGPVQIALPEMTFTSCGAANYIKRRGSIRKNIIGHATGNAGGRGMPVRLKQFLARGVRGVAWRPLALLDEPPREHGASVLFHPLIEQRANLLAEIGGMAETRKLIALQRIARCREKELPRRLGVGTRHVGLQVRRMESNRRVIQVYSTHSVPAVEICGKGVSAVLMGWSGRTASSELERLRACSACAGDYEDPDRTAWTPEESDKDENESAFATVTQEFPDEK